MYCEYPLGRYRAGGEKLAEAARKTGVHAAIGLQLRASTAAGRAHELVAAGAVGRALNARILSTTIAFGPDIERAMAFAEKAENGVTLPTIQGAHTLDLAIAVLGKFVGEAAMDLGLRGKVCLVTGASSGIGRAAAVTLAAERAQVVGKARSEVAFAAMADEVRAAGGEDPVLLVADLTEEGAAERLAAAVLARAGPVDVLVNNAGGSRPMTVPDDGVVWAEGFRLNFERPPCAGMAGPSRATRTRTKEPD